MTLSNAAHEVIRLANRIREYWDIELPKRHPNYPVIKPSEDDGPPPPEEAQLRKFLENLPEDTIYELVLLMRLGFGDVDTGDLAGELRRLRDDHANPELAISELMGTAPLGDYLFDGLETLRTEGIDVDDLLGHPAKP